MAARHPQLLASSQNFFPQRLQRIIRLRTPATGRKRQRGFSAPCPFARSVVFSSSDLILIPAVPGSGVTIKRDLATYQQAPGFRQEVANFRQSLRESGLLPFLRTAVLLASKSAQGTKQTQLRVPTCHAYAESRDSGSLPKYRDSENMIRGARSLEAARPREEH